MCTSLQEKVEKYGLIVISTKLLCIIIVLVRPSRVRKHV